jgi:predicted  nucleic acid-binding Zn-ribbon protein
MEKNNIKKVETNLYSTIKQIRAIDRIINKINEKATILEQRIDKISDQTDYINEQFKPIFINENLSLLKDEIEIQKNEINIVEEKIIEIARALKEIEYFISELKSEDIKSLKK